jgi:hypothetical protein
MFKSIYKNCIQCDYLLPANRLHFKRLKIENKHILSDKCRRCLADDVKKLHFKNNMLLCLKCNNYKPFSDFNKDSTKQHRNGYDSRCKICKNQNCRKVRLSKTGNDAIHAILNERLLGARERSKSKSLQFSITNEYLKELWIIQKGKCALSGLQMTTIAGQGRIFTNVSVGRVDPNKGYIIGNIQLVCMIYNQMKSDLTKEELLWFCKKLIEKNEN